MFRPFLSSKKSGQRQVSLYGLMDGVIKKGRSICNFLVNSHKETIFLPFIGTSNISKIVEKLLICWIFLKVRETKYISDTTTIHFRGPTC